MNKKKIAIFASGRGSNAQKVYEYTQQEPASYEVALIISNKPKAGVISFAKEQNIPHYIISRKSFYETDMVISELQEYAINIIILAGFLWLIPEYIVKAYPKKIINIHPALLPKYGGKGMYGMHVHLAVKENDERKSGITIHFADEAYDEGQIIFQTQCLLSPKNEAEDIAKKVLLLEHYFFPRVIEGLCKRI